MSRDRPSEAVGMMPFWLTFRGAQLEERWQATQKIRRRNGDEGFFLIFGLLISVGALRALRVSTSEIPYSARQIAVLLSSVKQLVLPELRELRAPIAIEIDSLARGLTWSYKMF